MSIGAKVAKHVILDRFESQMKTAEAKLKTLKLKAEAAKAILEIRAIVALLPKVQAIQQKLQELKASAGDRWEQAKTDVEGRIAELENSLTAIQSKVKTS